MKNLKATVVAIWLVSLIIPTATMMAAETVTKVSGGSVKTDLGDGIVLNEKSSLTREWFTIHDDSLPADISGTVGIKTIWVEGWRNSRGGYQYSAEYSVTTNETLSAFEIRFLTFDLWGNHSRNLSATTIIDIPTGATMKFEGNWKVYSENEVAEYYASIAYIAQVRTKSGRVFKVNPKFVLEQARKFSEKFTEGDLEPEPEKK